MSRAERSQLLQGNRPLLLGDRDVAWVLDYGSAAVFVVDLENGEPKGPRRYLFTVKPGDVLLGMSGAQGSRHQELMAVPIEATQVSPVAADEPAITAWISRFSSVLGELRPEGPVEALDALAVLEPVIFRALDDLDRRRVEEERSHFRQRHELDQHLASQTVHDLASVTRPADGHIDLSSDPPCWPRLALLVKPKGS